MNVKFGFAVLVLAWIALARTAAAQWTQVIEAPNLTFHSVWVNGDTIVAGAERTAYISTDAGAHWKGSAQVPEHVLGFPVEVRARMRNGLIYAATRSRGVFVSHDMGDTWSDFNQGLVGGFANSQLDITDLHIQGDSLYLATEGAGAWVRNLTSGTWRLFGNALEA